MYNSAVCMFYFVIVGRTVRTGVRLHVCGVKLAACRFLVVSVKTSITSICGYRWFCSKFISLKDFTRASVDLYWPKYKFKITS